MIYILTRTYDYIYDTERLTKTETIGYFTSKRQGEALLAVIKRFQNIHHYWSRQPETKSNIAEIMPDLMKMSPDDYKEWYRKYERGEVGEVVRRKPPEPQKPKLPFQMAKSALLEGEFELENISEIVFTAKDAAAAREAMQQEEVEQPYRESIESETVGYQKLAAQGFETLEVFRRASAPSVVAYQQQHVASLYAKARKFAGLEDES